MSERHRGVESGREDATHTILWLHGYTGSPDAFAQSAERFAKELDAKVYVPLLPGHGTDESHLPAHRFDEFLSSASHYLYNALAREKPIALIGYSFGGYLAALLATKARPAAIVFALTPYRLRFPFWIPGVSSLLDLAPYWGKHMTEEDVHLREGTFYYQHLPGKSLSLIEEGNRRMQEILPKITSPILTLHNSDDPLASPASGVAIVRESAKNPENESKVFPHDRHTFFMSRDRTRDEDVVIEFLARQFQNKTAATQ